MRPITYSKPPITIFLFLVSLIILGEGCCCKQMESVCAVIGSEQGSASRDLSEVGVAIAKRVVETLKKAAECIEQPHATRDLQQCCGRTFDKCEEFNNGYKDQLLSVLDEHMQALKEPEKEIMEEAIFKLSCPCIAVLKNTRTDLIEVLEGISAEIARNQELRQWLESAGNSQNKADECPICLSALKGSPTVLPCSPSHAFHPYCIQRWVYSEVPPPPYLCQWCLRWFYRIAKPTCPLCRKSFSPTSLDLI